ncbi:xanthine dehydrogenase small subunit [Pseudomonas sp. GCM10022188]|uniref:xanthine dehydrogenase small subunit n=1 Tax=Pseudomonas TaxID=286 RepID=UPI001E3853CD|nr:xanthine dehydrogenase small subunit [Pseudomonas oryzagri]MCC6076653.1 xanthine dehydrogenase small subunit [Pseudomonas oryzagri]
MIQFLLNREPCRIERLDPNLTVLRWLRERRGRTGSKEGCASGDCGACTVVVGERLVDETGAERLRYRAINACIALLSSLHGKQLLTVEDLQQGDHLHSVQQAMVDCHGSQCGFCTPGFVMSLFALSKNAAGFDREEACAALSGNLCRCTGYRPILAAAEQALGQAQADSFAARETEILAQLAAIAAQDAPQLDDGAARCLLPRDLAELADLYAANPQARLLAGGTDLALEITQQHRRLPLLIQLGQVAELQTMRIEEATLDIGAAVPLTDCAPVLAADYPDFGALLARFAATQIRNQATLGGNLGNASPIGDGAPLLLALGASLLLRQGARQRLLPLEDFFLDYRVTALQPGEFIERILVPRPQPGHHFRAFKVTKRLDDDISAVCAAVHLHLDGGLVREARIAFGGMAAIPKRASQCEQALIGRPWAESAVERAASALEQDFSPLDDLRASRAYRLRVAQNLLRKTWLELSQPDLPTRVTDHV